MWVASVVVRVAFVAVHKSNVERERVDWNMHFDSWCRVVRIEIEEVVELEVLIEDWTCNFVRSS